MQNPPLPDGAAALTIVAFAMVSKAFFVLDQEQISDTSESRTSSILVGEGRLLIIDS